MTFDPAWEALHREVSWGTSPEPRCMAFVKDKFDGRRARILELGCGAGAQAVPLVEAWHEVHAVDGSATALRRVRERAGGHPNLHLWNDDVVGMTAMPCAFDCVIDVCTLQHLTDKDAIDVTQAGLTWLKPGGWFWSKQAVSVPAKLRRGMYLGSVSLGKLARMFDGYEWEHEMLNEPSPSGETLWHIIVRARRR